MLLLVALVLVGLVGRVILEGVNKDSNNTTYTVPLENSRTAGHTDFTGFSAWAQTTEDYEAGEIVRFSGILYNAGGDYNPPTGTFVCRVSGVYFVSIALRQTSYDYLGVKVYKGTEEIMVAQVPYPNNLGVSVANSRLVQCEAGDQLYMQAYIDGAVYGEPGVPYSTFTAFLMQQTVSKHEGEFLGFSASQESNQEYVSGDTLHFSNVLYNEGGHFKPATNRFECPLSGLYYVSVTLRKYGWDRLTLSVSKSTLPLLDAVDDDDSNYFTTSSNTALVRCEQNQNILVEGTGEGTVYGDDDVYTTFSAMLLYSDAELLHTSFVGFTMYKKSSQTYNTSQTISFDGQLMNEGGHFQQGLNRFVCPVNGVYYVSLNAKKDGENALSLDVLMQTDTVFRLESARSEHPSITVSGSALVKCTSGWVMQVRSASIGSVYGHHAERHTTFTVFMLYQE